MISIWIILASGSMGFLLGFLTSASNTPIAGVVVTSVFGGAVGVLGTLIPSWFAKSPTHDSTKANINPGRFASRLGLGVVAFCLAFLPGSFAGANYRMLWWPDFVRQKQDLLIPWGEDVPKHGTPGVLLTWIRFAQEARKYGMTDDDILKIYNTSFLAGGKESTLKELTEEEKAVESNTNKMEEETQNGDAVQAYTTPTPATQ